MSVGRIGTLQPEDAEQNVNPAVMREAVAIQMTWVGARPYTMAMKPVCVDLLIRIAEGPIRGDMKIRR